MPNSLPPDPPAGITRLPVPPFGDGAFLLPGVAWRCRYDPTMMPTTGQVPAALRRAVVARQAGYAAGRYCAGQALAGLGVMIPPEGIGTGPAGEPLWPPGVCGSITHTATQAMAVVCRSDVGTVGIDLEDDLRDAEVADLLPLIATLGEWQRMMPDRDGPARTLTLIFSAKEALYKALYPGLGRYIDFLEVTVIQRRAHGVVFRLPADCAAWLGRDQADVWGVSLPGGVLTACLLPYRSRAEKSSSGSGRWK